MNGFIRIISGKWRGRKLPVLNNAGLRPTTDRIKETLFNWLMPFMHQANCLDCFSGSGSLGFEALSRGANQVVFLEKNRSTATQLKDNKLLLKADNCEIVTTDSLHWLDKSANTRFNLVFIDPPFKQNLVNLTVELLVKHEWLDSKAYIYIETELNNRELMNKIPANWQLHRENITGQVHSRLFIRTAK